MFTANSAKISLFLKILKIETYDEKLNIRIYIQCLAVQTAYVGCILFCIRKHELLVKRFFILHINLVLNLSRLIAILAWA